MDANETITKTQTITTTLPVTDTGTPTQTVTTTATVTQTAPTTATETATTTFVDTASGTVTATTTVTSTIPTTVTVTATTTATKTATTAPTTTATSTQATTGTYTQTITQISTYNDYTVVQRSLPPIWACPAGAGTGGAGGSSGASAAPTDATLAASDCKSLADLRRPNLKAQARNRLDQARASLIAANCFDRSEMVCLDKSGQSVPIYNCRISIDAGVVWGGGYGGSASVPGIGGAAGGSGATQYSTTNTQVASVDEADYVKNDGNTIFVLAKDGLHVIDAWPAAETREIARVSLPGSPRRLFLLDNRLVVYTQLAAGGTPGRAGSSNPSDQGCTYGYDCRFTSEGGRTQILVFDVTAPAAPVELLRYEMSGGYVASRRIGANVYTVVHDAGATEVPGVIYTIVAKSYEDMEAQYAQLLAANDAKIDASPDDFFLPWLTMSKPGDSATPVAPCQYALATQYAQGGSFVSVNTFDLTTLGAPTRTLLASNAGYVYASATSLYLAVDRLPEQTYGAAYYYSSHQASDSFVHKFKLDGTDTSYAGSVTLPGHILNQFAMDEYEGVLRVASTRGWAPSANVASYLTTYGVEAGKLTQLGQVGGIAPQEDIRSVRFDGERGYVVTFKEIDPLFVFDLVDARNPTLMGELLIPGFSTYMHPLDKTHLLALGFTADDQGSFAYFSGIQIQIFDVSVLSSPKVLWKKEIGTRGSSSEALTNHLAFNYFAPKKMLALPLTVCEAGDNGSFGTNMTFAGLMAFDISLETGIAEHGRLPFAAPTSGADCSQWWTNSKSLVKRSIFMDDFICGLSDAQLQVAALAAMNNVLASVSLAGP